MKKIYISLLLLVGLLASCDMDRKPFGALEDTTAIQNMNDLGRLRNGMYTSLRAMTAGSWVSYSDIQMDEFHGLINNGNRLGIISNGLITASDADLESMFASCYGVIAKANFAIQTCEKFAADKAYANDLLTINRYMGEAKFLRAYAYFYLIDHFCQPISQINPATAHSGVMIVRKYEPSGDISTYPSRSTLEESYAFVESDLKDAYETIKAYEAEDANALRPNAEYLSSYAVEAMQARVALVKGDYTTAKAKADDVINSHIYSLTSVEDYGKLWSEDTGTEVIFRPYMSSTEGLISTGADWTNSTSKNTADYIPTFATLAMYTEEGDVRFDTFFPTWQLDIEGNKVYAYVFQKYPGNTSLWTTSQNNYVNMPKPFRLSEMYLIAAEAAAINGESIDAYMNEFLKNRISGYSEQAFPTSKALSVVKEQRQLEFIGEGFRMSDLRRWNEGFTRYAAHEENPELEQYIVKAGAALSYYAGDYRFTWPIPKSEIDSNPNVKNQQNPGY